MEPTLHLATNRVVDHSKYIKYKQYLDDPKVFFSNKDQSTTAKVALVAITVICGISTGIAVAPAFPLTLIGKTVFGSMAMLAILLNAFASFSEGKSYGAKQEALNAMRRFNQTFAQ